MPLFVSFEGGEGSGKSTQAELLCRKLQDAKIQPLFIHEPGTTNLGIHLRDLLKGKPWGEEIISVGAELFLFAAARAELVSKVIKPIMRQNTEVVIVADRYADSTVAYQGYGRRLPLNQVRAINSLATQGLMPDLTFLLDLEPDVGKIRVGSLQFTFQFESEENSDLGRMDDAGARRFEEESLDFHKRVRRGYRELAAKEPERWYIVDATLPIEEISEIIWNSVQSKLLERASQNQETDLQFNGPSF